MRRPTVLRAALLGLALAAASFAQAPADGAVGWHTVAAGETLRTISERYLGSSGGWREIWKLNPDVVDPERLEAGSRLRVYLAPPGPAARVEARLGAVELRAPNGPWIAARDEDLLGDGEVLRTREAATATLRLPNGASASLRPQTQVLLRRLGPEGATLQLVEGGLELEGRDQTTPARVALGRGGALVEPVAGRISARVERDQKGTTALMIDAGRGQLAVAGASVAVAAGFGVRALAESAPGAPEPLLPAPLPWRPEPGAILDHANPRFSWNAMPGASAYRVELCRNLGCSERLPAITVGDAHWTAERLPLGQFHWRVRGIGRSGLEGRASAPLAFSVRSQWRRPEPR